MGAYFDKKVSSEINSPVKDFPFFFKNNDIDIWFCLPIKFPTIWSPVAMKIFQFADVAEARVEARIAEDENCLFARFANGELDSFWRRSEHSRSHTAD